MADKASFRAQMRERETDIPESARLESDRLLREQFLALDAVERAHTLLLFYGMGYEVDTRPLLDALRARGKRVLLPRCLPGHRMEARQYDPARLQQHRYGMWEPDETCPVVEQGEIDLILVPALCYDRQGRRMGRGGGFYDRYLADFGGVTVGLCRSALLCEAVPTDPWDRPVQCVLTERGRFMKEKSGQPRF